MLVADPPHFPTFVRYGAIVERAHPTEQHWYLEVLSVRPEHQRQGLGSRLVTPILERANRDRVPCDVQTADPANVEFYRPRSLGEARVRAVAQRLIDAFERGEIPVFVALLVEDAVFQMPPYIDWCQGCDAIAESWLMPEGQPSRVRYVPIGANPQPALGVFAVDPSAGDHVPLDVLTLSVEQIASVTAFRRPDILTRFDVPDRLTT